MPNPFIPLMNSLLPEPQASLLNGILWGTRASMPREVYQALIDTGTVHIVALSGMNITILTNLAARMTQPAGKKVSIILTIVLIISFVLFVGPSASVVRAAIMGSLSLVALYFGRQSWGLYSLFVAGLLMVVYDFQILLSISFQLSFLATLGILLAAKYVDRQKYGGLSDQMLQWFRENLRLTIAAQLFTLPVIFFHFHRISLIAPAANLAVEWAIQPIMILGFVTAILGLIWQPLGYIPAWIVWVPLTYVLTVIDWLGKLPFAAVEF